MHSFILYFDILRSYADCFHRRICTFAHRRLSSEQQDYFSLFPCFRRTCKIYDVLYTVVYCTARNHIYNFNIMNMSKLVSLILSAILAVPAAFAIIKIFAFENKENL